MERLTNDVYTGVANNPLMAGHESSGTSCTTLPRLQIPARLPPPVFIDDIDERDLANGSKPAHRIADRQQSIGVDVRRQTQRGLGLLLELQVKSCQCRSEAERARRKQHVLNCWIDRRAGPTHRCLTFKARIDPHRGLLDVRGQIFRGIEQSQKLLAGHAREPVRSGSCSGLLD